MQVMHLKRNMNTHIYLDITYRSNIVTVMIVRLTRWALLPLIAHYADVGRTRMCERLLYFTRACSHPCGINPITAWWEGTRRMMTCISKCSTQFITYLANRTDAIRIAKLCCLMEPWHH
jgi:hypothetical protein